VFYKESFPGYHTTEITIFMPYGKLTIQGGDLRDSNNEYVWMDAWKPSQFA
jgi:hypothetical protein